MLGFGIFVRASVLLSDPPGGSHVACLWHFLFCIMLRCYYTECPGATGCHRVSQTEVWMRGRGSACLHPCQAEHYSPVSLKGPKLRCVCNSCHEWLCSNDMADPVDGMGQCVLANCGRPYHIVLLVGPNASTGSFAIRLVWRSLFGMCVFFLVWHICLL
jgi:hypothetical protein